MDMRLVESIVRRIYHLEDSQIARDNERLTKQ